MEWVETTGKTIDEALDAALDQLGVDEDDAEYEILDEPKVGLFGRVRGEARIRARVRPTRPRPKEERRGRRRSGGKSGGRGAEGTATGDVATVDVDDVDEESETDTDARPEREREREPAAAARSTGRSGRGRGRGRDAHNEEDAVSESGVDVPMEEQGEVAVAFLEGLLAEFGTEGSVASTILDDESFEVSIRGQDLGLLIGPKGTTMSALQDLTRTVVQRKTSARSGRLLLDVAGYRQKRKEALERFARAAAEKVLATGSRVVLEPMTASDRKIVHDTVNDIEGVSTTSQGEDPRRRVVLLPENGS